MNIQLYTAIKYNTVKYCSHKHYRHLYSCFGNCSLVYSFLYNADTPAIYSAVKSTAILYTAVMNTAIKYTEVRYTEVVYMPDMFTAVFKVEA